jgi:anoctamin-10
MHDRYKKQLQDSWSRYRNRLFFSFITGNYKEHMQPLNFIANYYGEKMGFYFAWLSFYTSWLLIPAIPGVFLFIYQMILLGDQYKKGEKLSIDSPYNCLYSLIMSIWSTVLMEVWKRRQHEIAHLWSMTGDFGHNKEMPEYRADVDIDSKNRQVKQLNTANSHVRRIYGEIPIVSISIGIVIACFIANYFYNKNYKETGH